jgi:hypothetical protein
MLPPWKKQKKRKRSKKKRSKNKAGRNKFFPAFIFNHQPYMESATTIIPPQHTGWHSGAKKQATLPSRHEAILLFDEARKRLLDVNQWQKLCGNKGAEFQLTDANGNPMEVKVPKRNYLIRIALPAPPNKTGQGYDWVRIEEFEEQKDMLKDEERFGFRVRPVPHPRGGEPGPAHFYTRSASSSFLVIRSGASVTAMEQGRNELPNTGISGFINKLRNGLVAISAMLGFANPQWKKLMHGVLYGPPKD